MALFVISEQLVKSIKIKLGQALATCSRVLSFKYLQYMRKVNRQSLSKVNKDTKGLASLNWVILK